MEIRPVRRYALPRFPTHEILEQHPEILRYVPQRWQSNPVVLTALAGVCLLMNTCRATGATDPKAPVSRVAPIFVHGSGMGSYGCKAVAAPVYMSEAEARSIIEDEAKRAGITFRSPGCTVRSVETPKIGKLWDVVPRKDDGSLGRLPSTWSIRRSTMQMDGTDARRGISFEFVSHDDFRQMAKDAVMLATVGTDDILGTSALLRNGLQKANPKGYCAVFYDPVAHRNSYNPTGSKGAKSYPTATAKQELRAQVKDFIKWLKAQGVI